MRFLIISLFLVLFFLSCAIPTIKGLPEHKPLTTEFHNPYFADIHTDYVYKAKINAYDNVFGGILIIKKLKEDNHRIVFTTNFGNKIFDFELIDNEMKTHFVMKELNRNVILNALKRDFQTLTQEHNKILKSYKKKDQFIIHQSKSSNRYNHYLVKRANQQLTQIVNTTHAKEKIIISFYNIHNSIAKSIKIEHKNSPIQIDLTLLNN